MVHKDLVEAIQESKKFYVMAFGYLLIGGLVAFGLYWTAKYASMSSVPAQKITTTSATTSTTTTTEEIYQPSSEIYQVPTDGGNEEEITTMQNMPETGEKENLNNSLNDYV